MHCTWKVSFQKQILEKFHNKVHKAINTNMNGKQKLLVKMATEAGSVISFERVNISFIILLKCRICLMFFFIDTSV